MINNSSRTGDTQVRLPEIFCFARESGLADGFHHTLAGRAIAPFSDDGGACHAIVALATAAALATP